MEIREVKGTSINPDHVETNIVIVDISQTGKTASQIVEAMKEEKVLILATGKTLIRLVTHLDVSREDIEIALKGLRKVLR
jgi:threonine aldolase